MATNGLKINGVNYRSFTEVEDALRELGANYALLPEDSDELDPLRNQILALLDALPDERAQEMAQLLAPDGGGGESATDDPPPPSDEDVPDGHVRLEDGSIVPLCPMCNGGGILDVEPPQDPTAQRCPACHGYGQVYTGSRVHGQVTRACPTCQGNGFTPVTNGELVVAELQQASPTPLWGGAIWNPATQRWNPPDGAPPWENATWNDMTGAWS